MDKSSVSVDAASLKKFYFRSNFGKTNSKTIVNEIVDMNQNRIRISTLGFGPLAEMKILKQIAGLNGGSSRRVFEELDAAAQVK